MSEELQTTEVPEAPPTGVLIEKPILWMLLDHLEFAIKRGSFNHLTIEEQVAVMRNILVGRVALQGYTPQQVVSTKG